MVVVVGKASRLKAPRGEDLGLVNAKGTEAQAQKNPVITLVGAWRGGVVLGKLVASDRSLKKWQGQCEQNAPGLGRGTHK